MIFQNRDDSKGGFGGPSGGANRGQGSGSNFDRGSQEQLGGLGRGGLNNNRYVLGVFEQPQFFTFEILGTPPRPSGISMKNWGAKVKPILTPHL